MNFSEFPYEAALAEKGLLSVQEEVQEEPVLTEADVPAFFKSGLEPVSQQSTVLTESECIACFKEGLGSLQ